MDERARSLDSSMISIVTMVKDIQKDIKESSRTSKEELDKAKNEIADSYVKKMEFDPVQRLVYGFVAAALIAFGGIFLSMINRSVDISWINPRVSQQQAQQSHGGQNP